MTTRGMGLASGKRRGTARMAGGFVLHGAWGGTLWNILERVVEECRKDAESAEKMGLALFCRDGVWRGLAC